MSLFVGGVGIMNTMYTAVVERNKDIGIMKAIGARNDAIFSLFLIESGLLGLAGLVGFGGLVPVSSVALVGLGALVGLTGLAGLLGITGLFGLPGLFGFPGLLGLFGLDGLDGLGFLVVVMMGDVVFTEPPSVVDTLVAGLSVVDCPFAAIIAKKKKIINFKFLLMINID